jgi:hypothetical protein
VTRAARIVFGILSAALAAAAASAQTAPLTLAYDVPPGWAMDAPGARKAGVELMFLPRGKTPDDTDRAIAIAYQAKNPKVPDLADLETFVRADMAVTRQSFPDMLLERWQPKAIDPQKIRFLSVEIYGSRPNQPPPHRVLILDAGDGFYSITFTAENRTILHAAEVDAFFDSLRLGPAKETK